jgi:hypothetical protein
LIRDRVGRWRFTYADEEARTRHEAIRRRAEQLAPRAPNATALAARAVEES